MGVVQNDNGELEAGGVLAKFPILKEESSEIYFEWKNLKYIPIFKPSETGAVNGLIQYLSAYGYVEFGKNGLK